MDGEVYADFVAALAALPRSRGSRASSPAECWLERWSKAAQEQGTRALDGLRDGVETAIAALGSGFLAHPANAALREALRPGELTAQDYYRQLLRLVYRLLFLFVAEDRGAAARPGRRPRRPGALHRLLLDRPAAAAGRAPAGDAPRRPVRRPEARHGAARQPTPGCPELGLPGAGQLPLVAGGDPPTSPAARSPTTTCSTPSGRWRHGRGLRCGAPVDYRNLGVGGAGQRLRVAAGAAPGPERRRRHVRPGDGRRQRAEDDRQLLARRRRLIARLLESALDPRFL